MERPSPLWLILLMSGVHSMQAQTVCRPADATSAALIQELGRYSSATFGGDKVMRDSLHLTATPASEVVLVTSESTCKKANAAYQTAVTGSGGTGLTGRVYVAKVGQVYGVLDPSYNAGEPGSWTVIIVDSRFTPLSSY
jgi:hypothetical protein